MAGGLSLTNTRLAMPLFVIPTECYAVSMSLSNSCRRTVRMFW